MARNLLALHAALARRESLDTIVSMRDAMAAEHLAAIVERERPRGRVLAFLHSAHLLQTRTSPPGTSSGRLARISSICWGRAGNLGRQFHRRAGGGEPGALLAARQADCFLPVRRDRAVTLPVREGIRKVDNLNIYFWDVASHVPRLRHLPLKCGYVREAQRAVKDMHYQLGVTTRK